MNEDGELPHRREWHIPLCLMGKEIAGMKNKDSKQLMQEYTKRQSRQIIAIAIALFTVLLCAILSKRPGWEDLRTTLFGVQAMVIAAFLGFTSYNWTCPSCGKHLGADINRRGCKKCGVRLQ